MELIFEIGREGRGLSLLPPSDVPTVEIPAEHKRGAAVELPTVSENEISRHYTKLAGRAHGVNDGFYPLGSCTMKYNPKVNDEAANLPGFTGIHPLQKESTVQGCMEAVYELEEALAAVSGMDAVSLQPAAGAHGEFTGLLLMKAYHVAKGNTARRKIIVPDSAHGTNPASAVMCDFDIINIPSGPDGCVDLDALKEVVGEDTAGLMLTNPNTVGIFDKNILQITEIVHGAGGLCYYDGANLNAIMGLARPGDMGFDVMHFNLHKTMSTPHGGGGPGAGPVGCKEFLKPYLPGLRVERKRDTIKRGEWPDSDSNTIYSDDPDAHFTYGYYTEESTVGAVKNFYGNFLVCIRALVYLLELGQEGVPEAAKNAVLNANYMKAKLADLYTMPYEGTCMHEFVMSLSDLHEETGVSALDIAKGLLDYDIHPPTMYFPLIVHEALMLEPTETEPREVMDEAIEVFRKLYEQAHKDPDSLHSAPHNAPIARPDEVGAARNPIVQFCCME